MEKTGKYFNFYYTIASIDEKRGIVYLKVGKYHEIPVRIADVTEIS